MKLKPHSFPTRSFSRLSTYDMIIFPFYWSIVNHGPCPLKTVYVKSENSGLFLGLSNFFKQFSLNSLSFGISGQTLIWTETWEYETKICITQVTTILFPFQKEFSQKFGWFWFWFWVFFFRKNILFLFLSFSLLTLIVDVENNESQS